MNNTKVLYVEDEPFLAQIVKESLESRGFIVKHVDDGNLVLNQFNEFTPDICVLDVMLPHKDGFEIAKEIKELKPSMPLIFLTAKTQTTDILTGFHSGGNDYLKKPFSMEELIVRIQNLLHLTGNGILLADENNEDLKKQIGSFVFYPQHLELHFNHCVRKLSQREAQIIQLLTADTSIPVMRKKILLELWGDDSFYNSRNLDVYISRLRDYFSEDPDIKIVTLKGVGYHFKIL